MDYFRHRQLTRGAQPMQLRHRYSYLLILLTMVLEKGILPQGKALGKILWELIKLIIRLNLLI